MVFAPRVAATLLLAATVTACGAKTADYTTLLPSSPTSTTASTSTTPTPIAQYLSSVGVTGAQVPLDKLTDLTVTLPRPPGWTKYSNPNFSPGTEAIAKNNTYPTAMVMVFKLSGNFDLPAAMKHANDDALLAKGFTELNSSEEDFNGFPSSMIEGSYDHLGTRLHTYNRVVVPVTATFERYLVQFTVTTLADQAAASAPDVEKVIAGFSVSVK
jgi:hypothetical protein